MPRTGRVRRHRGLSTVLACLVTDPWESVVRFRAPAVLVALAAAVLSSVTVAGAAHAATAYTWTGATSTAWGTASNWSPAGVPGNGDSVTVSGASATNLSVTGVPPVSLQALSVSTAVGKNVSLTGPGPVSVAGTFSWSGGDVDVPLSIGGTGTVAANPATPAKYGASGNLTLTVTGSLVLAGPGAAAANSGSSVELMFDSSVAVSAAGRLDLADGARLLANRCCSSPTSTLVNNGTVRALGGTSHLDHVGLDQSGTVSVAAGATLDAVGGPMRVFGGTLTGTGTLSVPSTSGDAFDPAHPTAPDNTLKLLGTLGLAGTTVVLGAGTEVSGVGAVSGSGAVRLAGARLRGAVTIGVPVTTVAGTTSRTVVWNKNVVGQHGDVTLAAGGEVVAGSTLAVHSGTRLVVATGHDLALQQGSVLSSDGCCTDPGQLVVNGGLKVTAARLQWVTLGGSGTVTQAGASIWALAGSAFSAGATITGSGTIDGDLPSGSATLRPTGTLAVSGDYLPGPAGTLQVGSTRALTVGGTARLAGTLDAPGVRVAGGRSVEVLGAGRVEGTFGCTRAAGVVATYAARSVSLLGVPGAPGTCARHASGTALKATFSGTRAGRLKPPAGATRVLLQVSVKGAVAAARLRLKAAGGGTATVRVAKGKKVATYVVLKLGKGAQAKKLTASLDRRASVTLTQVGYY